MPEEATISSSGAVPAPTQTPIPIPIHNDTNTNNTDNTDTTTTTSTPSSTPSYSLPTLRLEIRDLSHPGSTAFLTTTTASTALSSAIRTVLTYLYPASTPDTTHIPPTRSVTLILRSMPGVAYTTGTELDGDHKEIHFSLDYISSIAAAKQGTEIQGVLVHEVVHCYQYNGRDTCPGGLVEGVADWVRLKAGLGPEHWRRGGEGEWDGGYDKTAYFLEWVEGKYGEGVVRRLNERLREGEYEEKAFWEGLVGVSVGELWGEYCEALGGENGEGEGEEEE